MFSRRKFLAKSAFGSMALALNSSCEGKQGTEVTDSEAFKPTVIATWAPNKKATKVAWKIIEDGGKAIDAVEQGVQVPEGDPNDQSVGYGGRPDRDGNVTLDACIMDEKGNCGSVCYLQHIKHPIAVARKVMDETPHVILAGEGHFNLRFQKDLKKENLLTDKSKAEWEEWMKEKKYQPIINIENHDTIGMLALDKNGDISGACTTSGLAYKMQGRVGDSPIIGAGLFIDNEIGGATATGMGEAVLKTLGSFLVVELMRQGRSPQEACEEAVMRIVNKQKYQDFQIGYLAMNKKGEVGSYCIHSGFNYAQHQNGKGTIIESKSYLKSDK